MLLGVQASQGASTRGAGVGVRSYMSSFDRTASRQNGIRPAPQKAEQIFADVNDRVNGALKAGRNSSLVIWLMW